MTLPDLIVLLLLLAVLGLLYLGEQLNKRNPDTFWSDHERPDIFESKDIR